MRPPETNDANKKALIGQSGLDSPQVVTSAVKEEKYLISCESSGQVVSESAGNGRQTALRS
jgi:hypothetical protein